MIDKTPYIEKFKQVYQETYKVALTEELAVEYFEQLLRFYMIIYHPSIIVDNYQF